MVAKNLVAAGEQGGRYHFTFETGERLPVPIKLDCLPGRHSQHWMLLNPFGFHNYLIRSNTLPISFRASAGSENIAQALYNGLTIIKLILIGLLRSFLKPSRALFT